MTSSPKRSRADSPAKGHRLFELVDDQEQTVTGGRVVDHQLTKHVGVAFRSGYQLVQARLRVERERLQDRPQ